jgi:hypothetical protein
MTAEFATAVLGQAMISAANGDLLIQPGIGAPSVRLHRTGPLRFEGDSGEVIGFRLDERGAPAGFTLSGEIWDPSSWDRVSRLADARVHVAILGIAVLMALSRIAVWTVAGVHRRIRHGPASAISDWGRRAWRLSGLASALFVCAPVVAAAVALLSFAPPAVAIPRALRALSLIAIVAEVIAAVLVYALVRSRGSSAAWRARYVHATAVAAALFSAGPVLWYWHLLALAG